MSTSVPGPASPPPKVLGRHRWIATAAFTLTPAEAAAAAEGAPVDLDRPKLMFIGVGCIDCEEQYEIARTQPCLAGDEWPT